MFESLRQCCERVVKVWYGCRESVMLYEWYAYICKVKYWFVSLKNAKSATENWQKRYYTSGITMIGSVVKEMCNFHMDVVRV
jgi:hypothetical protein